MIADIALNAVKASFLSPTARAGSRDEATKRAQAAPDLRRGLNYRRLLDAQCLIKVAQIADGLLARRGSWDPARGFAQRLSEVWGEQPKKGAEGMQQAKKKKTRRRCLAVPVWCLDPVSAEIALCGQAREKQ